MDTLLYIIARVLVALLQCLPLRWVAILYRRIPVDFAITSGVHNSEDVLKALAKAEKELEDFLAQVKTTNRLIREYVASNDQLLFIDTFTPMLTADGRPRADVYLKDGLHPNAEGYAIWASILRPILDKYDTPGERGKQP